MTRLDFGIVFPVLLAMEIVIPILIEEMRKQMRMNWLFALPKSWIEVLRKNTSYANKRRCNRRGIGSGAHCEEKV
jgi:hypothetical protein